MPPQHALPASLSLKDHLPTAELMGAGDVYFNDVTLDSRECRPKTLFVAAPGRNGHGGQFLEEAVSRGAVGVVTSQVLANCPLPQCIVANPRAAYAYLSQSLYGHPASRLRMMGVTGTNGKTTVSWMTRALMAKSGHRTGLLGTVEYFDGYRAEPSVLTTPDAKLLAFWQHRMVSRGTTHLAMELSSHALDQSRAAALPLDCAIVTNITHDHLDYHGDFASYREAKARILDLVKPGGTIALHINDPGAASIVSLVPAECRLIRYGVNVDAELSAQILSESLSGTTFRVQYQGQVMQMKLRILGRHNIENALAALAAGLAWKVPFLSMAEALEEFRPVPGRMERCTWGEPFDIFVDYAHTPDALSRALCSLRGLTRGRLICVFGAGGDRDATKRPLLGRAASQADVAIITSDNPRSEDPEKIIQQICDGVPAQQVEVVIEADRKLAIQHAIEQALPGDMILIAGKGHESEQIIGGSHLPFDDRRVVRELLENRSKETLNRLSPVATFSANSYAAVGYSEIVSAASPVGMALQTEAILPNPAAVETDSLQRVSA